MDKKNSSYDLAFQEMEKENSDIELVKTLLQKADEENDDRASYALATWYLHGKYFKRDLKKGVFYLKRSIVKKNREALYDLAICYEKGKGVKKDIRRAFMLYLEAALRGDDQSIEEVARCYYYGLGVEKDVEISKVWYTRAKELEVGERNDPK